MTRGKTDQIKIVKGWESLFARPVMYIGKKSIYGLMCFVTGVQCSGLSIPYTEDKFFEVNWYDFEEFVREKFKNRKSSFDIVTEIAKDDQEKAFDLWAELFTEYKNEKR